MQLRRLRDTLANAYINVPTHRTRLDAVHYRPGELQTLADLHGSGELERLRRG